MLLALAVGCDSSGTSGDMVLSGTFAPLNGSGVTGDVTFTLAEGDTVVTLVVAGRGLFPNVAHAQNLHEGSVCPGSAADSTTNDDANGDGFLDISEGLVDYGDVRLPLDDDLSDRFADTYPTAGSDGSVQYTQTASATTLRAALGGAFGAADRTVLLLGVDSSAVLPPTVASLPGVAAQQTLPVACAVLSLVLPE